MDYGKCLFVEERHPLLEKAKIFYAEKRQEGSSTQFFIAGSELSEQSVQALPQGWALRSLKKAASFSAKQNAQTGKTWSSFKCKMSREATTSGGKYSVVFWAASDVL